MAPLDLISLRLLPIFLLATSAFSGNTARAASYSPLGCYNDNVGGKRALTGASTSGNGMTVDSCAKFCARYQLFGLEYGRECYCGDTRDKSSTSADASDCSFNCAGDPTQKCGAGNKLNLYNNLDPQVRKPATLTGVTSLGCFVDKSVRVLPNKVTSSKTMTAATCATNCEGFTYFGTQYGTECYCGNTAPTESAPASECNMACKGNDDELCGAGMRLNVYKVDTIATPALTGFEYKGCYTDNVNSRTIKGKTFADPAMTLEKCAASCTGSGYSLFGVEYGTECYCGSSLDSGVTSTFDSACGTKCPGNNQQACGGANHLSVFSNSAVANSNPSTSQTIGSFFYQSCWTDAVGNRALTGKSYAADNLTPEICADKCKDYKFFGLEYSRECYCGNTLDGKAAAEKECAMLCMGAPTQLCGGPDRMNLYVKTPLASTSTSTATSTSTSTETSTATSTETSTATSTSTETSTATSTSTTTTTTQGPDLTTITACPAAPTYNGSPSMCYDNTLPGSCEMLRTSAVGSGLLSYYLNQCKTGLRSYSMPTNTAATACFPTPWVTPTNAEAASAIKTSVIDCLMAPSASLQCQSDSNCVTKTYTVGQVPEPTPSIGVELTTDGDWESGTKGNWTFYSSDNFNAAIDATRPRSGSFGFSGKFMNLNGYNSPIQRMMSVTPGATYEFKVWFQHTSTTSNTFLTLYVLPGSQVQGVAFESIVGVPVNQWTSKSLTFTAKSSWVLLQVVVGGSVVGTTRTTIGMDDFYIDDLTLVRLS